MPQMGLNTKPRGVEAKVSVQLHLAALPGEGTVTLGSDLASLGLTFSVKSG